ncbi:uncharacterized protein LOC113324484 [Papaver somniferum]|uniref:uncharacterized protein LOC113324484 n=1 Tax=Papaver somniferum TaxID=3469 RepID=UPI000E6FE739|nr:uncharacterized protein LOC113324484 [Papaver somniferum]
MALIDKLQVKEKLYRKNVVDIPTCDMCMDGVIRDEQGRFCGGFAKYTYNCGSNVAELCAIREGLLVAEGLGIRKLEIESDSMYAIQVCRGEIQATWYLNAVQKVIKFFCEKFEVISFSHKYREANNVTDVLAKGASKKSLLGVWLSEPPREICESLFNDLIGITYP